MFPYLLVILLNFLCLQSLLQGQMRTKGVQSVMCAFVWRKCTKRKHNLIAPIILITLILPIFSPSACCIVSLLLFLWHLPHLYFSPSISSTIIKLDKWHSSYRFYNSHRSQSQPCLQKSCFASRVFILSPHFGWKSSASISAEIHI